MRRPDRQLVRTAVNGMKGGDARTYGEETKRDCADEFGGGDEWQPHCG
jgi:hypothetical protein